MPSRLWYGVAAAVLIAGIAGAVMYMMPRLGALESNLTRIVVPGSAEIELAEAGSYTVFHEARSVVDGKLYYVEDVSGLNVTLVSLADGQAVPLRQPGVSANYNVNGRSGVAVLAFDIAAPGRYRFAAAYGDGRAEPKTVLTVSQGFVGDLLKAIFGTLGIGFASFAVAVLIFVLTLVKRQKAMRARAAGPAAGA